MTMNNILKILMMCPVAAGGMLLASCTDVEKIEIDHIGGYNTMDNAKSEAYYAKLRDGTMDVRLHSDGFPTGRSRELREVVT